MKNITAYEWLLQYRSGFPTRAKSIRACSEALNLNLRSARKAMKQIEDSHALSEDVLSDELNPDKTRLPKVLLFDIETAPMELYGWRLFKQYPNTKNIIKNWSCLSWAAKWLCDDETMSCKVTSQQAIDREDKTIMEALWNLVEKADIIIAHNAKRFDVKRINTRFILNGLKPPRPYQVIDTLVEAKKHFAFASNKLDFINTRLGMRNKIETTYELWKRCVTGDETALEEMEIYNREDVVVLEDLYFQLRPWIKSHPNIGLFVESTLPVCPNCGSFDLDWKGYYNTPTGRYKSFRCNNCGAIGRNRHTVYPKDKRHTLTVSTAR